MWICAHLPPDVYRQLNLHASSMKDEVGLLTQGQRAGVGATPPHFPVRLTLVTTSILSEGGIHISSSPV